MKPLSFSNTQAHPGDPLPVHLERVAQRAAASIAPSARPEVRLITFLAGLFHDIGKATPYFQDYMLKTKKKTELTSHAKSGAVLSWWYSGELDLALWVRLAIFIAILRHHGALNFDSWKQSLIRVRCNMKDEEDPLQQQLSSMDWCGIHDWFCEVAERNCSFNLSTSFEPPTLERIKSRLLDRHTAVASKLRQAFQELDEAIEFVAGWGGVACSGQD